MHRFAKPVFLFAIFSFILLTITAAFAQYRPESFSALQWRLVGPHRAGRVTTSLEFLVMHLDKGSIKSWR